MEIQKNEWSVSSKMPPTKPLEGYFQFRQEMMENLNPLERTSENIVKLWNQLSGEEKAIRLQQNRLRMHQYEIDLQLWNKMREIPLIEGENSKDAN